MPARPIRTVLSLVIVVSGALAASACFSTRVQPQPSKAVIEARARGHAGQAASACPDLASPVSVGFAFGEGALSDLDAPALGDLAAALACHPGMGALIVGQADGHGTPADQAKLAAARAQAVADDLKKRGVAPDRLATQAQGTAPAGDARRQVVLAEGRRW